MKEYLANRQSKDSRFLAIFKKAHNKDRLRNSFTPEESANELGLSLGTLEQKLKPSADNDITVTEWNHHLELTADFSTLSYFAQKHGFLLNKIDVLHIEKDDIEISNQADSTMIEFNESWAKVKKYFADHKLNKQEKLELLRSLDTTNEQLQQLRVDIENMSIDHE